MSEIHLSFSAASVFKLKRGVGTVWPTPRKKSFRMLGTNHIIPGIPPP